MVALQEEEILVEDTEPTDEDEPQSIRYEIMSFPTDFTVKVMYEKCNPAIRSARHSRLPASVCVESSAGKPSH